MPTQAGADEQMSKERRADQLVLLPHWQRDHHRPRIHKLGRQQLKRTLELQPLYSPMENGALGGGFYYLFMHGHAGMVHAHLPSCLVFLATTPRSSLWSCLDYNLVLC